MTYDRREQIFSKDAISTAELAEILGVSKSSASSKLQEIKRVQGDRLGMQGFIHIEDYFAFFHITDMNRYRNRDIDADKEVIPPMRRKTVCFASGGEYGTNS